MQRVITITPHLISHYLCPYVQRAAIALTEKDVEFERSYIDLANKPDWFLEMSPLGETPVLSVDSNSIFESSAILEYLEESQPNPLLPSDPLEWARHCGWVEFGSAILNGIAGFYNAPDASTFEKKRQSLSDKFEQLEHEIDGDYPAACGFGLVDAAFAPVF